MQGNTTDRLFKIKPILDYFVKKCQLVYKTNQEISLDEDIIPWRGKLKFRTYNPAQIIKYGLLVRVICETTTGYTENIEIYGGKGKRSKETILSLSELYLDQWYHVYQDNYYNSIKITENLLKNKVRICKTIRKKQRTSIKFKVRRTKIEKEMTCRRNGKIFLSWKDI